jgi:hypothetical protein
LFNSEGQFGSVSTDVYAVAAGATVINPGEPVAATLGSNSVTIMATNKPVVGTDYLAGIAVSTSTQTASVAGSVTVRAIVPGQTFLIAPKVAYSNQAAYDALVRKRVLIDLTTGKYTLLAVDGATSGCVIMPADISKTGGKAVIAFRQGVANLS